MNTVLPLLALRAFAEVGRHGSIKRAAEAMGVTAGAVSQQIRQLEARVGQQLFTRTRYGVRLSECGAGAHPGIVDAYDQIRRGLEALDAASVQPSVTVSTLPAFAASWLVPRLGRFTAQHPQIEVRVEATSDVIDLRNGRVDVAIRHGLGRYDGLASELLMAPVLVVVASPELIARNPPIETAADCLAYPLLQDADRADWQLWLTALGLPEDARAKRGPSFDDELLLMRAAEAGQGLAMVRDVVAAGEIEAGRLVVALEQPWPTAFGYYAVTLPGLASLPHRDHFISWLKCEARNEGSELDLIVDCLPLSARVSAPALPAIAAESLSEPLRAELLGRKGRTAAPAD